MIFFFLLILFSAISLACSILTSKTIHFISVFSILAFFVIVAGGRFEFASSGDWFVYQKYFDSTPPLGQFNNLEPINFFFEPSYFFLNSTIKLFTKEFQIFLFLFEIIVCILLYLNLKEYSIQLPLSLFIYFVMFFLPLDLIMIRFLLAMQIFIYSIRFIQARSLVYFVLLVLLATSFHYSSAILLPLYFVLNKRFSNVFILSTIALGLLLLFLRIDVLTPLLELTSISRVADYQEVGSLSSARKFSFINVEFIFFLVIFLKYRSLMERSYPKYFNIFLNMYFIYGILLHYFFGLNAFSGRLKFFFLPSLMFLLPILIGKFQKRELPFVQSFFLLYFSIYLVYLFFLRNDGWMFLEYKNILFI